MQSAELGPLHHRCHLSNVLPVQHQANPELYEGNIHVPAAGPQQLAPGRGSSMQQRQQTAPYQAAQTPSHGLYTPLPSENPPQKQVTYQPRSQAVPPAAGRASGMSGGIPGRSGRQGPSAAAPPTAGRGAASCPIRNGLSHGSAAVPRAGPPRPAEARPRAVAAGQGAHPPVVRTPPPAPVAAAESADSDNGRLSKSQAKRLRKKARDGKL